MCVSFARTRQIAPVLLLGRLHWLEFLFEIPKSVVLALAYSGVVSNRRFQHKLFSSEKAGKLTSQQSISGQKPVRFLCRFFRSRLFCLAIFILRNFELFVEAYDTHSPWTANHGLFGTFPPPASVPSYLVNVCLTALGVPLYFCSLSGMVLAGFTRDRKILILLITVLPFWLFLEIIHYHQLRFSVTLLPFLCLLAAYFIDFLMKANLKYARALAGSALVLTLLYSATYTYAFIHVLEVERDPRFVIARWMEENAVDEETVAVLGHDITTNSLGFIRYDGMDRLSGRAYSKPGYPRFIFLPSGSSEILDQYLELTANGYTYSQEDWWPIAPPSEETIRLFENLSEKDNYEIVRVFRNKPQFNGIQFDTERLKFDTFRITDLEILVYERKLPGSRTDS